MRTEEQPEFVREWVVKVAAHIEVASMAFQIVGS